MVNVAQITTEVPGERTLVVGRPTVRGKFLYVGNEKFWVRGVSYGTFFVDDNGEERLNPEMVARDFALMAANGFNVVRVHTGPPRWLLDMALENGLRVMVGLNWGEHMAFMDDPGKVEEITARVRRRMRACARRPERGGIRSGDVGLAGPSRLASRLLRGHRIRVDGRVVPWAVSGRGLGVRVDDPRSDAEARPGDGDPGVRGVPVPLGDALAEN